MENGKGGQKGRGGRRRVVEKGWWWSREWKVGNMVEKQDRLLERFHIYTGVILLT